MGSKWCQCREHGGSGGQAYGPWSLFLMASVLDSPPCTALPPKPCSWHVGQRRTCCHRPTYLPRTARTHRRHPPGGSQTPERHCPILPSQRIFRCQMGGKRGPSCGTCEVGCTPVWTVETAGERKSEERGKGYTCQRLLRLDAFNGQNAPVSRISYLTYIFHYPSFIHTPAASATARPFCPRTCHSPDSDLGRPSLSETGTAALRKFRLGYCGGKPA